VSPFVIDNQEHRLADVLIALLGQTAGKPLDVATASFAVSGFGLVKNRLHQIGAFRLLLGAEVESTPRRYPQCATPGGLLDRR